MVRVPKFYVTRGKLIYIFKEEKERENFSRVNKNRGGDISWCFVRLFTVGRIREKN